MKGLSDLFSRFTMPGPKPSVKNRGQRPVSGRGLSHGHEHSEEIVLPYADGVAITISLRRMTRTRRLTLRLDPTRGQVVLTLPKHLPKERALAFLQKESTWIREKYDALPKPVPFQPGIEIPLRGEAHCLLSSGRRRGLVVRQKRNDGWDLVVPGDLDHLARRVLDFLKTEARRDLEKAVARHAADLNVNPTALRLRDQKTRWGSCSSNGTLSFSWRLILAPPDILDYLAAHEVSHLVEMNHSARFWALCRRQAPQTDAARDWLRANGDALHRVGRSP